ncbi:hypothetical protein BVRB_030650, partial [Beta vulgaris subsp. vulgaris]
SGMSSWSSWLSKLKRLWTVNPASKPYIPSKTRAAPSSFQSPVLPKTSEKLQYKIEYFPREPAPAVEIVMKPTGEIIQGESLLKAASETDPDGGYQGGDHLPRPEWMTNRECAKILKWCEENNIPP